MSQSDAILDALKRGETLTPLHALKLYGCFRLGARIFELRKAGHEINTTLVEVGNRKHVAAYSLSPIRKGENYKLAI